MNDEYRSSRVHGLCVTHDACMIDKTQGKFLSYIIYDVYYMT